MTATMFALLLMAAAAVQLPACSSQQLQLQQDPLRLQPTLPSSALPPLPAAARPRLSSGATQQARVLPSVVAVSDLPPPPPSQLPSAPTPTAGGYESIPETPERPAPTAPGASQPTAAGITVFPSTPADWGVATDGSSGRRHDGAFPMYTEETVDLGPVPPPVLPTAIWVTSSTGQPSGGVLPSSQTPLDGFQKPRDTVSDVETNAKAGQPQDNAVPTGHHGTHVRLGEVYQPLTRSPALNKQTTSPLTSSTVKHGSLRPTAPTETSEGGHESYVQLYSDAWDLEATDLPAAEHSQPAPGPVSPTRPQNVSDDSLSALEHELASYNITLFDAAMDFLLRDNTNLTALFPNASQWQGDDANMTHSIAIMNVMFEALQMGLDEGSPLLQQAGFNARPVRRTWGRGSAQPLRSYPPGQSTVDRGYSGVNYPHVLLASALWRPNRETMLRFTSRSARFHGCFELKPPF